MIVCGCNAFDGGAIWEISGLFSVESRLEGYDSTPVANVTVGSSDIVITMFPPEYGRIRVHVMDSSTQEPVLDARVFLASVETQHGELRFAGDLRQRIRKEDGTVDHNGDAVFDEVPSGTASILGYSQTYGVFRQNDIEVVSGAETYVPLSLLPGGILEVEFVRDGVAEGRSPGDLWIVCVPIDADGKSDSPSAFSSDLQDALLGKKRTSAAEIDFGGCTLHVQPGTYNVVVGYSFHMPEERMVSVSTNTQSVRTEIVSGQTTRVKMEIGSNSSVRGYAETEHRSGRTSVALVPGRDTSALIEAEDWYARAAFYGEYYQARVSSSSPEFLLAGVIPGPYTLALLGEDQEGTKTILYSEEVQVQEDSNLDVRIIP